MIMTQAPTEAIDTQQIAAGLDDAPPPAYIRPTPHPAALSVHGGASITAPISASSSRRIQSGNSLPVDQAKQALARFGNPYATNSTWSPSEADWRLRKIPSLALTMRLQQRFARKAGDIFNPPCPSLQRDLPATIAYDSPFEPCQCKGKGDLASDGFKSIFIGAVMAPRDVSSADWFRFIQDLTVASRLNGAQEALAGITPVTKYLSFPGAIYTRMVRYSVVRKREPLIFETIEEWNARFFAARGIDVFVHNGSVRLTATTVGGVIPPLEQRYWRNNSKAPQLVQTYSNLSESSDEDEIEDEAADHKQNASTSSSGFRADLSNAAAEMSDRREHTRRRRDQKRNADDNSKKMMMLVVAHRKRETAASCAGVVDTSEQPTLPAYDNQAGSQVVLDRKS